MMPLDMSREVGINLKRFNYRRFLGFPLWRSFSRMRISLAVNTSAVYNEAMGWKWIMQQNNLKRLLFYKYNKSCR